MPSSNTMPHSQVLKTIFYVQIGLLALLAVLFILGYYVTFINVGSFFFAVILGALGSTISLIKRAKKNEIDMGKEFEQMKRFSVLMPILYGSLLAGVAYLLFMSGILSGPQGEGIVTTILFPNFTEADSSLPILQQFVDIQPENIQDTGKLLVWCFVAGYSERFVIGILDQLETKGSV